VLIKKETKLHHGDRIEIGINHFFRLNCPTTSQQNQLKKFESEYDLIRAQEEILFSKLKDLDESEVTSDDASNENLNNKSLMSTSSSSSSSSIGQPVYEIIQNSAILNANDEHVQQQILLGYKRLRNQLVKTHSLAREANSIARELNLSLRFTVTLHTPAKNLTPNHKVNKLINV
jgi:kinesin family protein 13